MFTKLSEFFIEKLLADAQMFAVIHATKPASYAVSGLCCFYKCEPTVAWLRILSRNHINYITTLQFMIRRNHRTIHLCTDEVISYRAMNRKGKIERDGGLRLDAEPKPGLSPHGIRCAGPGRLLGCVQHALSPLDGFQRGDLRGEPLRPAGGVARRHDASRGDTVALALWPQPAAVRARQGGARLAAGPLSGRSAPAAACARRVCVGPPRRFADAVDFQPAGSRVCDDPGGRVAGDGVGRRPLAALARGADRWGGAVASLRVASAQELPAGPALGLR